MSKEVIHIYCVPGMAANVSIFEFLKLPEHYQIHTIPWEIPIQAETLEEYAKRLSSHVTEPNAILLGVSFGGIVIQEMSRFLDLRKLIIVSSVKSKSELPKRFEVLRFTGLNKIFPTSLVEKVDNWEKLLMVEPIKKVGRLYDKYLTVKDKYYLDWSIENIINWTQEKPMEKIIHIQGSNDAVFPIKNISNCIEVPNGTHAMIVNRARWFNENLPKLIEG